MTWIIYRPDEKKLRKYWKVGIELSIHDNAINYTPTLSFRECQKNIMEFTESTHIIYRPAKIA